MEEEHQSDKSFQKTGFFRCGVVTCPNTSTTHPQYSFYKVPNDSERKALWLKQMQRSIEINSPKQLYVCQKHFENKYLNNESASRWLRQDPVPTQHIPQESEIPPTPEGKEREISNTYPDFKEISQSDVASLPGSDISLKGSLHIGFASGKVEQIDANAATTSSAINETRMQRNLNEIFDYEKPTTIVKIEEENDCLTVFVAEHNEEEYPEENLTVNQSEYVTTFANFPNDKKQSRKHKYSKEYKMFALDLYFKSRNAYRLLQTTFNLPRISTIYRLCIPKTNGLSQDVLKALSIKVEGMTPTQKQSVVCIGTMSLLPMIEYDAISDKIFGFHDINGVQTLEPARHVLIVIVRGLFHNWKQAIDFSFLSNFQKYEDLNFFIDEIISKLLEIGLNVRILMSDLIPAIKHRALSLKDPFFYVGRRKIYFMYDILHLMRNVRDSFLTNNLTFNNCLVAKSRHLVNCYEYDKKNKLLRLAPKLSDHHIIPKLRGASDSFKLIAELFSKTTATAISTCIDLKVLEPDAKDTVQWILTMSKLMDMLNFSTEYPPEDKTTVFSGETTQVDFLIQMLNLFNNIRLSNDEPKTLGVINNKDLLIFKEGFTLTINSLLLLYTELKTESSWLPVVGLTHDCLNDFFDKVCQKYSPLPTAQQMVMCITKFPIFTVFQYSCKRRAPGELQNFLTGARQMPDINMYDEEVKESYIDQCANESTEFPSLTFPNKYKIKHLASYLLFKGYEKHCNCEAMKNYVCGKDITGNDNSDMTVINKINLVSPQFVQFIEVLEITFKSYFKKNTASMTLAGLQHFTKDFTFEMPCECFPLDFIKQLFYRYRLYCILKYNNALFAHTNYKHVFFVNNL